MTAMQFTAAHRYRGARIRPRSKKASRALFARLAKFDSKVFGSRYSALFARADNAGQARVVRAIFRVPQGKPLLDPAGQHRQLFGRTSRRGRRGKALALSWGEVLVVSALQNGLKYVPHLTRHLPYTFPTDPNQITYIAVGGTCFSVRPIVIGNRLATSIPAGPTSQALPKGKCKRSRCGFKLAVAIGPAAAVRLTGAIRSLKQVGYPDRHVAGPVMSRGDFLVPARWVLRLTPRQDPLLFSALRMKSRK